MEVRVLITVMEAVILSLVLMLLVAMIETLTALTDYRG